MELTEVKIIKYPEVKGCYGNRYAVPLKRERLIQIFEALKIWRCDRK